jgi:hypothetical protein
VLESVVQKINIGRVLALNQFPHAIQAVFVYSNLNVRELLEILQWFVAHIFVSASGISAFEASGLSSIASAQCRYAVMRAQYINKVFHRGRFSCSAKVEVAHANRGILEPQRFQNAPIIKFVPDCQHNGVEK